MNSTRFCFRFSRFVVFLHNSHLSWEEVDTEERYKTLKLCMAQRSPTQILTHIVIIQDDPTHLKVLWIPLPATQPIPRTIPKSDITEDSRVMMGRRTRRLTGAAGSKDTCCLSVRLLIHRVAECHIPTQTKVARSPTAERYCGELSAQWTQQRMETSSGRSLLFSLLLELKPITWEGQRRNYGTSFFISFFVAVVFYFGTF